MASIASTSLRLDDPPPVPAAHARSWLRIFAAIVLLVAMGLLAAASVGASRPWIPAKSPKVQPHVDLSTTDPC